MKWDLSWTGLTQPWISIRPSEDAPDDVRDMFFGSPFSKVETDQRVHSFVESIMGVQLIQRLKKMYGLSCVPFLGF